MSKVEQVPPPTVRTTATDTAPAGPRARIFQLGKYREIALAVGFFLVFDLAVLVVNFYSSYRIAEDAVAINLSGRQRMLSQRMTKAILDVDAEHHAGRSVSTGLDELQLSASLFGTTLEAFSRGGVVTGGDGQVVHLQPAKSAQAQALLADALALWRPYEAVTQQLVRQRGSVEEATLRSAVQMARATNLKLLDLMNRLTTQLEDEARNTAAFLRQVQMVGISLALLNFLFILFKFIRRLQDNDARIERAQGEIREILATVKEGLFLLDTDRRVGDQRSASLGAVLGSEPAPGADFFGLLAPVVSAAELDSARDYVDLLFAGRVKESLVQALNPLAEVKVSQPDRAGKLRDRWLSFQFNRVVGEGTVTHLLVTVQDVTKRVELEGQLSAAKSQARVELDVLLHLLEAEPTALRSFLERAELALSEVNDRFKEAADHGGTDYNRLLSHAVSTVHGVKGEAAVLRLEMFETLAHEFERELAAARDKRGTGGDDMVRLTLRLDELFERLTLIREITERLGRRTVGAVVPDVPTNSTPESFIGGLRALAHRIAADQGKSVEVLGDLQALELLPEATAMELRSVAIQLIRNAVSHGIESPEERQRAGKPAAGMVYVACNEGRAGTVDFVLRDDGRGVSPGRIRQALVSSGRLSLEQAAALADEQVIRKIFEPGLSTAESADLHAGRGVGMDLVWRKVNELGARLRLQTQPDRYTQFTLSIDRQSCGAKWPAVGSSQLQAAE